MPDNALVIDECRSLDLAYTYIGVYSRTAVDAENVNRLRLLYDLREHTGAETWNDTWSTHWAAFAARFNDHWSGAHGYNIIAFKTLDGLPETLTNEEMRALPYESNQPAPMFARAS